MKNEHICIMCGKHYSFCQKKNRDLPAWRTMFHNSNCHDIFNALRIEDPAQAKLALGKLDLSEIDSFNEDVKNRVHEILGSKDAAEDKYTSNDHDLDW